MTKGQRYSRARAANFLQANGLATTAASLATYATRGGGPPYFKIGKLCFYWQLDLQIWMEKRCTGLLDSTSTSHGKEIADLFEEERELQDLSSATGQPGFNEITRLLSEEAKLQDYIDQAGLLYDQQFI